MRNVAQRRLTIAAPGALAIAIVLVSSYGSARGAPASDPSATLAQMDVLWEQREARDVMPELTALGAEADAGAPSYEVEWRLARAYFWVAYGQSNRVTKKGLAGKAAAWADKARTLGPDRVEGHYFYALAIGAYADCIGVVQAVVEGIASRFETAAVRAYEIDRDFEHGAPVTVLGRYYYMLPWPKRDLERSRGYLEEAVKRHPRALIAQVYLADTYYALDERDKARAALEFALTAAPEAGSERDQPPPKPLARAALGRWFPDALVAGDPRH
jgi:tetratricopeptide (TPR) repeat protein